MKDKSDSQNELSKVLEKICEIAEKSANGDYIFRGETKLHQEPPYYGRVSSNLCREYLDDIEKEGFQIEFVQEEILDEARKYSDKGEREILTELQHYGSKTNLIDFTTDYLIALFFACDGSPSEDGRIILQKKSSVKSFLQQPIEPKNRIMAQKSIFVRPPKGYFNPDTVIIIEADLKEPMLEYLRNSHSISTETIYNDLHGFITNRGIHESAYIEFHRGMTCNNRADSLGNPVEEREWHDKAIAHYTEALKLKPDLSIGYNNRGNSYSKKGDYDRAIQDYDRAIELNPNDAVPYSNRGNAYNEKGDYDRAIQDYDRAIELDPSKTMPYNSRGSVYNKKGDYDRAIQDYDRAIELNPNNAIFYDNRGLTYSRNGEFDLGIEDFSIGIKLDPNDSGIYCNRGEAWLHLKEWESARADLTVARDMGEDIIASFHNDYESVTDFEQKNDIQLPEDIKAMLTQG